MTRARILLNRMKDGELIIGSHASLFDCSITEELGVLGFDFVWIEHEHSSLDKQTIQNHIIAAKAGNTASFVRLPWNDHVLAKPILDMSPDAVVFPFIRTADEARQAIAACRYPPKGIRGFGPRRGNLYGKMPTDEYLETVDDSFLIILQIEHIVAVRNLDEILRVPGFDSILIGPNDLSGSVGLLGQTNHPEMKALFDEIAGKAKKARIPFGVSMGLDREALREWVLRGVNWAGFGNDSGYIAEAGKLALEYGRSLSNLR